MFPSLRPAKRQPFGAVRLNEKHWLAKNLLFVHTGSVALYYGKPILPIVDTGMKNESGSASPNGNPNFSGFNFAPDGVGYASYPIPTRPSNNLTLLAWVNGINGSNNNYVLSLGGQGGQQLGRTTVEVVSARAETVAGTSALATSAAATTANVWAHTAATFESDTSRAAFLNGASKGTIATSISAGTLSYVTVLARRASAATAICLNEITRVALPMVIDRVLTDDEILRIYREQLLNPWSIFSDAHAPIPMLLASVIICRPTSDILTTGWTASTGSDLYAMVDEAVANDSDYVISPLLSSPTPLTFGITPSAPAGTHTVRVRAKRTETDGQVRVHLLDGSNSVMGSSAWQALTATDTTYTLSITTSGAATRMQIEVAP